MWCFVAVNSLGKTYPISIKANIAQYCQFLNFGVADGWIKQVAICCSANKELPPECSCVRMILHGRLPSKPYLRSSATASFPYLCQRCCLAVGGIKERPANTIIHFLLSFYHCQRCCLALGGIEERPANTKIHFFVIFLSLPKMLPCPGRDKGEARQYNNPFLLSFYLCQRCCPALV